MRTGDLAKTGIAGANLLAANGTAVPGALGMKNGAPAALTVLTVADGGSKRAAVHRVAAGGRGHETKSTETRFKTWAKIQAKLRWQS